jgi:hypothetical protein
MRAGIGDRLMRTLSLIVVCILMCTGHSHAQTINGSLRGLKEIRLLVEAPSKGAEACGVTPELIRDAFMYPASASRLRIANLNSDAPTFYIVIGTVHTGALCVSSVIAKVFVYHSIKLDFSDMDRSYRVELWFDGSVYASGMNEHARQIERAVEESTKRFVTDWNLDNKHQ